MSFIQLLLSAKNLTIHRKVLCEDYIQYACVVVFIS